MTFKEMFKPFLSNIFDAVMKEAMEDQVITPEESVLLSQIEVDIRSFEKEVAQCIEEEGGIEKAMTTECFKDKLLSNVRKIALEDGTISKDEEAILNKLEEHFRMEYTQ